MFSPCMKCDRRTVTCHIACGEYSEYRRKLDELNRDAAAVKAADNYISDEITRNVTHRGRRSHHRVLKTMMGGQADG